jgi:hypothetical protein
MNQSLQALQSWENGPFEEKYKQQNNLSHLKICPSILLAATSLLSLSSFLEPYTLAPFFLPWTLHT